MGLIGDFFTFFNEVMVGNTKDESEDNPILSTLQSESTMYNLNQVVQNKLMTYTSNIEQNVRADQKIVIDCGSDKLEEWHIKNRNEEYTWYGKKIPYSGCPQFGCCYDVTQKSQIKLIAINETTTENHTEMWNTVRQKLEQEVSATVGNNPNQIGAFTENMNVVANSVIENIKTIMDQASNVDYENSDIIQVKSKSPLRCINKCNEPPTAGEINQYLNIEIISQNIVNDTMKLIVENLVDMESITETKVSNVDIKKLYLFAIFTVLLIIVVYTICYVASKPIIKFLLKIPNPPSILRHFVSIILMIIIYRLYSGILCIIRKWPASAVPFVAGWCLLTGS